MNQSKSLTVQLLLVLTLILMSVSMISAKEMDQVMIIKPWAKIYKTLNPDSGFLMIDGKGMVKKGTRFDLEYAGDKWYRIYTKDGITGFVPISDGKVVPAGALDWGFIATILIVVLIIIGALYAVLNARKKPSVLQDDLAQ